MSLLDNFTEEQREQLEDPTELPIADSITGLIRALEILAKYYTKQMDQKFFLGADHDIIYFYEPDSVEDFTFEDALELSKLGLHISSDTGYWAYFT